MSKIIAVNAGSSSLKFQLFEMPSQEVITSGIFERIGLKDSVFTISVEGEKKTLILDIQDHSQAVKMLLEALVSEKIVSSLNDIDGVGHRVVHGGEAYEKSVVVDQSVLDTVTNLSDLAPLHNPANLTGYYAFKEALPQAGNVFVFDTAFHQTMTPQAYLYPVPYDYYTKYGVRKYGFHGTSHLYVSQRTIELLGNPTSSKIITCHLGNGASLCAIKDGISIDTSMGFTPLAGVMMGTRSGDIDPAMIPFIMNKEGIDVDAVLNILNRESGMLGLSGVSSDSRDIENAVAEGNERAIITTEVYAKRVADYIGSYYMYLGGVDAIVFTAGIGENAGSIRADIMNQVKEALGIEIDQEANSKRGKEILISTPESKVKVFVVPTNEELVIAQDTMSLLNL